VFSYEEISKIVLRQPETVNSMTLGQPVKLLIPDIKADLLPDFMKIWKTGHQGEVVETSGSNVLKK